MMDAVWDYFTDLTDAARKVDELTPGSFPICPPPEIMQRSWGTEPCPIGWPERGLVVFHARLMPAARINPMFGPSAIQNRGGRCP